MKNAHTIVLSLLISTLSFSQTHVSGTIAGETWTNSGSPYIVYDNIFVASLIIEEGVVVNFSGNYVFEVGGVLQAIGMPCDSILFTQVDSLDGWGGIFFNYSAPGSVLAYCVIENSRNHGLIIENSTPVIRNCVIQNNSVSVIGTAKGGGVYGIGNIILTDCLIRNNNAHAEGTFNSQYGYGGGIYVEGTLNLIRCTVSGNNLRAFPFWGAGRTYGGGVAVDGYLNIENCIISHNQSDGGGVQGGISYGYGYGGGIWANDTLIINNSIISNNDVSGYNERIAGGIFSSNAGISKIINSTIAYNSNEGIHENNDTLIIKNTISYFNGTSQISGNVLVSFSNIQNGHPGVDNINFNPVFKSDEDLIIVQGSPCIDAGDDNSVFEDVCIPPSNGSLRNDIGANGGPYACGWSNAITPALEISFAITNASGPTQNDGAISIITNGGTLPFFFSWNGPNGFTSNNQSIENLFPGTYYLTYGDIYCTYSDTFNISYSTGIIAVSNQLDFSVFPNPAKDHVLISIESGIVIDEISVFNYLGQKVLNSKDRPSRLDVSALAPGIYILEIKIQKLKARKKIIKIE